MSNPEKEIIEIIWHARAGQGAVTAAKLFAEAALTKDKYFQAFPEYGPERMGAPIKAYTRVSSDPINLYSSILEPDVVIVLDATLLTTIPITDGLKDGGALIVNTTMSPDEVRDICGITDIDKFKIYTINANKIALDTIKRAIPNTPMVGALIKVTGSLALEDVVDHLIESFGKKFSQEIIDGNVEAVKRAYEEVRG